MTKLLVNSPSGEQEIIEVDVTGKYFDLARVLWDERIDGPMPEIVAGKMQRSGNALVVAEQLLPAHLAAILWKTRSDKIKQLQAGYVSAVYSPIEHAGQTWGADADSRNLLAQVLAVGSVPAEMYWRDSTGTPRAMTFGDLQSLAYAILERGLIADQNLMTKTAAVNAATTAAEIDEIVW